MKSMTGFSESMILEKGIEFKCISKSLNSRFLEISIKLPSVLKSNEGWIRDSIQKNFSRGKIDLEIFYSAPQQNQLAISDDLIKAIKKNEESIKSRGLDLEKVSYSEILNASLESFNILILFLAFSLRFDLNINTHEDSLLPLPTLPLS